MTRQALSVSPYNLVAQNRQVLLPVCFGAFERNARSHWNAAVGGLTINVRKMLMEMDQQLYEAGNIFRTSTPLR
jgi:hypothetical protein